MKKSIVGLLLTVVLAGCTRPSDIVIPALSTRWDEELTQVFAKLPEEDTLALVRYLTRARSGELVDSQGLQGVPPGTTVGEAIAAQRKFERQGLESQRRAQMERVEPKREAPSTSPQQSKQRVPDAAAVDDGLRDFARSFVDAYDRRQAEKIATAKCEADRPALDSAVSVRLLSSWLVPDSMGGLISNEQHVEFAILNNSAKTLIGVAGNIGFIDVFGKTIGNVEMEVTEILRPHAEHGWAFKRVARAHSTDKKDRLWELKDGKFKVEFVPETIVFEGGQTLRRRCM